MLDGRGPGGVGPPFLDLPLTLTTFFKIIATRMVRLPFRIPPTALQLYDIARLGLTPVRKIKGPTLRNV